MPEHQFPSSANSESIDRRLQRAEKLLDQWLDLYEVALQEARPDPNKITELVNVFTIIRRILEIRQLQKKVIEGDQHRDEETTLQFDPELFGQGISGDSDEGGNRT